MSRFRTDRTPARRTVQSAACSPSGPATRKKLAPSAMEALDASCASARRGARRIDGCSRRPGLRRCDARAEVRGGKEKGGRQEDLLRDQLRRGGDRDRRDARVDLSAELQNAIRREMGQPSNEGRLCRAVRSPPGCLLRPAQGDDERRGSGRCSLWRPEFSRRRVWVGEDGAGGQSGLLPVEVLRQSTGEGYPL